MNSNLVINWHILEPCNFFCSYCYAHWDKTNMPTQVYKNSDLSTKLIDKIASLQSEKRKIRLSFAGGEPLLDKNLNDKIIYAKRQQLYVSLITNGDLLDNLNEEAIASLTILGISIDSFDDNTNRLIGRCTKAGRVADYKNIILKIQKIKEKHQDLKIKINTVVNRHNFSEYLGKEMLELQPDKWKILRVLPAIEQSAKQIISDDMYQYFVSNHHHIPFARFEDNDAMQNSYIMIDPYGRFFFNQENDYQYSKPILDCGIENAFQKINFNLKTFLNRYDNDIIG